ncbi:unnamed protein product [Vitrella brassicaformis CCMP3155]|uniref:Uncharacterized protein n=1 Tax=Vitrella brassicaformis (strain CCMP3155) TaxID=1169540 RepID=A0A0G4F666_VITBC|nr:unnamed protein product [Vitrella brassicaformis CCMP3155]|eukprot:CEM07890.1 unnamed protein product [Vitrella brassicaformis CCMP3155]
MFADRRSTGVAAAPILELEGFREQVELDRAGDRRTLLLADLKELGSLVASGSTSSLLSGPLAVESNIEDMSELPLLQARVLQSFAPPDMFTPTVPPRLNKTVWKGDKHPEYDLRLGRLLDMITYGYPQLFDFEPDLELFAKDIVFEDPVGLQLRGRSTYKQIWKGLYYLRKSIDWYEIRHHVVWDPYMEVVRVSWHLKLKAPMVSDLIYADGISVYYVNDDGLVTKHQVTLLNARPPWLWRVLNIKGWLYYLTPSGPQIQWTQSGHNPGEGNHERNDWKRYYTRVKENFLLGLQEPERGPPTLRRLLLLVEPLPHPRSDHECQHIPRQGRGGELPSIDQGRSWSTARCCAVRDELIKELEGLWLYNRCQHVYPVYLNDTGHVVSDTSDKVPLSDFPDGYSKDDLLKVPPRDKYRRLRATQDPPHAPLTRIGQLKAALRKTAQQSRRREHPSSQGGQPSQLAQGAFGTCHRSFGDGLHRGKEKALRAALECRLQHLQGHGCPKCRDLGSGWEEFQQRDNRRLEIERVDSCIEEVEAAIRDGREVSPPPGMGGRASGMAWDTSHTVDGQPRCQIRFTPAQPPMDTSMKALLAAL